MANSPDETFVTLDGRKRAPLARIADHQHYLTRKLPDGTIVMRPAEVTPIASSLPAELDW